MPTTLLHPTTPLCDDELVAYLLAGIDEEFNPVFSSGPG
jgi:hypothetical protein